MVATLGLLHLDRRFESALRLVATSCKRVIAPGVERFEYFRQLERIACGKEPPETLRDVRELCGRYFLSSPERDAAHA